MRKSILPIVIIAGIIATNLFAQYQERHLPAYLKPVKDISYEEQYLLNYLYGGMVKGSPLPPEAYKMPLGAARIQNPEGFDLINVSNAAGGQHETCIAINPANPGNLIATCNDSRYLTPPQGYRMASFYTQDEGKTWTGSSTKQNQGIYIDPPSNIYQMTIFDPGITFDTQGWAYYSYGFTQTVESYKDDNGVFVCRSKDGGKTWDDPVAVIVEKGGTYMPFHDRYMITCDDNQNSPYKDNIYITWKKFGINPACLFSKSTDQNENWSIPLVLPGSEKNETQSATPVVGPNGEIYVVWENPDKTGRTTEATFQRSTDGGATWLSAPRIAQKVFTPGIDYDGRSVLDAKQNIRVGADPVIAVDRSNGPRRGWIYVVMAGKEANGKYGIFLARSTNRGDNWASGIRIDNNDLRNDMFMPSVTVDPVTGGVAIFYYSSQNDPQNKGVDGYVAYSSDGINFSIIRLTPATWYIDNITKVSPQGQQNNIYWGDYTWITSYNGKYYPLFWMPSPLNSNFNSLELYTAIMTTGPLPPKDVTATNNIQTPTEILLKWTDPEKNALGGTLGDFKIVITRDGTEIAQVDKGVKQYTDKGLKDGQAYQYGLKAKNTDGESEVVTVQATAGSALKPFPPVNLVARPNEKGILLSWTNPSQHVDGSPFFDFSKIEIYVNNELKQSVSEGIQSGQSSTSIVELPIKNFYKLKIRAFGKRENVETASEFTDVVLAYAGAPLTELAENFDNPEKQVKTYTEGTWATTTVKAFSLPNSLTDSPEGNYKSQSNAILFAPVIISPEKTTLSLQHIAVIDNSGADRGIITVSKDFGKTWTDIIWVDKGASAKFTDNIATSDWDELHIGMSKYSGDTVYIKFIVDANTFKNLDGWYIDDLAIDDSPVGVEDNTGILNSLNVQVTPNPAGNTANVRIAVPIENDVEIRLFDNLGREMINYMNSYLQPGEYNYSLNLADYAEGIYYCNVKFGKLVKTVPIVIER